MGGNAAGARRRLRSVPIPGGRNRSGVAPARFANACDARWVPPKRKAGRAQANPRHVAIVRGAVPAVPPLREFYHIVDLFPTPFSGSFVARPRQVACCSRLRTPPTPPRRIHIISEHKFFSRAGRASDRDSAPARGGVAWQPVGAAPDSRPQARSSLAAPAMSGCQSTPLTPPPGVVGSPAHGRIAPGLGRRQPFRRLRDASGQPNVGEGRVPGCPLGRGGYPPGRAGR